MSNSSIYKNFEEEDFINDPWFQEWVIHPDGEKDNYWRGFLLGNPEKKVAVENAVKMIQSLGFKEEWPTTDKIESSLLQLLKTINEPGKGTGKTGRLADIKRTYRVWWAAAAIFIVLAAGGFIIWNQRESARIAHLEKEEQVIKDIAAGSDRAILTLADGRTIALDSGIKGVITTQGNVKVINLEGQLAYNSISNKEAVAGNVFYNRITTPRGGQYRLVLADGTRVWLNSASTIRFPTRFDGHERKIELTGEGYFEVAKNASMPFRVAFAGSGEVEVLGTHFNINAYEDEPSLKVTLLEGSVRVHSAGDRKDLRPEEQAVISGASAPISVQKGIDVDQVISWKDDLFDFNNDPLPAVMRQLSRWYDADINYQGIIPEGHYTGSIRRQASLSEVLRMLELAGGVHFSIEEKRIVVEKKQR